MYFSKIIELLLIYYIHLIPILMEKWIGINISEGKASYVSKISVLLKKQPVQVQAFLKGDHYCQVNYHPVDLS